MDDPYTVPGSPSSGFAPARPHPEGTWQSPGYRSARTRALWVKAMFVLAALASLWELALAVQGYSIMDRASRGDLASEAEWTTMVNSANSADGLFLLAAIGTAIALMAWLSRSVENVPPLGGGVPHDSPRYAIGWWFVPIAFLWKPYTVVRETWDRLAPVGRAADGALVLSWWISWIVGGILSRVVRTMLNAESKTFDDWKIVFGEMGLAYLALVVSAVCGFLVVQEIQKRADERAAALGLEAPTARWPTAPLTATPPPSTPAAPTIPIAPTVPAPPGTSVIYCPHCGMARVAGERFCARCGTDLGGPGILSASADARNNCASSIPRHVGERLPASSPSGAGKRMETMHMIRRLLGLPFMIVAGIAFFLLGLQLIFAVLNLLNGATLVEAATVWLGNTVILGIVAIVTGVIGGFVAGNQD